MKRATKRHHSYLLIPALLSTLFLTGRVQAEEVANPLEDTIQQEPVLETPVVATQDAQGTSVSTDEAPVAVTATAENSETASTTKEEPVEAVASVFSTTVVSSPSVSSTATPAVVATTTATTTATSPAPTARQADATESTVNQTASVTANQQEEVLPSYFIDVSSHNGSISVNEYRTLLSQGVEGVVVKLTEGTTYTNPYAREQINNAKQAGLKVSAYHYAHFTDTTSAKAEARYFVSVAQNHGLDSTTVMVNDIEENKMRTASINTNIQAWQDEMKRLRYNDLVYYASASWLDFAGGTISTSRFGLENFWVAHYPNGYAQMSMEEAAQKSYYSATAAWQYTSVSTKLKKHPLDESIDYTGRFTKKQVLTSKTTNSSSTVAKSTLPSSGVYKFEATHGVKSEAKLSAKNLDYYYKGETVRYDSTFVSENYEWISYINYRGGRSYVAIKPVSTTTTSTSSTSSTASKTTTTASSSTTATSQAKSSLPSSGVYKFEATHGVKSEAKLSAKNLDYYYKGETVRYDRTLVADNYEWISYVNYKGGRSYVAIKPVSTPAVAPTSPSSPSSTPASNSTQSSLPSSGVYKFEATHGVKSEAKQSATNLDYYYKGETVRYDRTLVADNYEWISYVNYRGGRSYVAIKPVSTPAVAPTSPSSPSSTPASNSTQSSLPSSGVYKFEATHGVKSEAKQSATNLDYYYKGETVRYDRTLVADNYEWISYVNYRGGRSYVAIKPVSTPAVSNTSSTASATSTLASSGVYTFEATHGVKSEAKQSAINLDYYYKGETVRYDRTLVADNYEWISYINYKGGRSYVAIKPVG